MRFYVTTPIYYVNAEPHLGHAYTTIATDVLARHHRQRGDEVFFLTGVDEHGTKIAQAAEARGLTPREHVDEMAPKFRELARTLNATNDFFIRTTDAEHEAFVQAFVEKLSAAGDVEKRTYGGLYCTQCEGFWYERDLAPDGTCPDHGIKPEYVEEENYYFLLSQVPGQAGATSSARTPTGCKPEVALQRGAGVHRAGPRGHLDQPRSHHLGRPGAVGHRAGHLRLGRRPHQLPLGAHLRAPRRGPRGRSGRAFHLMAKDILKFHAVIWPALLMSAGYEVPVGEFIHGYLLMGGEKMSKTRGNVLDPFAVMETYGLDAAALLPLPRGDLRAGRGRSRWRASSSATRTSSPTSSATS